MSWPVACSIDELLARKTGGHYRIQAVGGRILLTVQRPGEHAETISCASPGHANQVRQTLSDEGLTGYVEGAR